MQTPTIPDDLKEALKEPGTIASLDAMPLDYLRRAFLFIEQARDPRTRDCRVTNFAEVVRFFQQDSGQ